jgi:predicted nucleic acid-binding protein
MEQLLAEDPAIVTWWGTPIECVSALARLDRSESISAAGLRSALTALAAAQAYWLEVPASPAVRDQAIRLLRVHQLRTGDALQLASALVASGMQPGDLEFVSLNQRQALAAEREGFRLP